MTAIIELRVEVRDLNYVQFICIIIPEDVGPILTTRNVLNLVGLVKHG